jgi:hypothetical protein
MELTKHVSYSLQSVNGDDLSLLCVALETVEKLWTEANEQDQRIGRARRLRHALNAVVEYGYVKG